MAPLNRRRALQLTAGALGTALAGCVDESPTNDDESPDEPTGSGTGTDETGSQQAATEVVSMDVAQSAVESARPRWHEASSDAVGHVTIAASEGRARAMVDTTELPDDRRESVFDLVHTTDFETELLAHIETVGPSTCYSEVEVSDLSLTADGLAGAASAVDTSGPDGFCGQAITYPSALLKVSFDGRPPDEASFGITDGWGTTATVTATTDDDIGPDPDSLDGYVRPDGDPAVVREPLTCDTDGFRRQTNWVEDPAWGQTTDDDGGPTFALRVDTLEAALGETVTITLTNVSDAVQTTGNRHKYALETYTEAGWQEVRGGTRDQPFAYTDEGIVHRPGEGFEWTLELTDSGLVADHVHADRMTVCPDLAPGRYRFVFWEPGVAVAFDVVA